MQICYDYVERKWYAIVSFNVIEKRIRGSMVKIPLKSKGDLSAGIDIGINNLYAVYIEDGRAFLINGRPLKAIAHYWGKEERIPKYQSRLNKSGYRTSRRLVRLGCIESGIVRLETISMLRLGSLLRISIAWVCLGSMLVIQRT